MGILIGQKPMGYCDSKCIKSLLLTNYCFIKAIDCIFYGFNPLGMLRKHSKSLEVTLFIMVFSVLLTDAFCGGDIGADFIIAPIAPTANCSILGDCCQRPIRLIRQPVISCLLMTVIECQLSSRHESQQGTVCNSLH